MGALNEDYNNLWLSVKSVYPCAVFLFCCVVAFGEMPLPGKKQAGAIAAAKNRSDRFIPFSIRRGCTTNWILIIVC